MCDNHYYYDYDEEKKGLKLLFWFQKSNETMMGVKIE